MSHPTADVALSALRDLAQHDPAAAHTGLRNLLHSIDVQTERARRTHAHLTSLAAATGRTADLDRLLAAVAADLVTLTDVMPKVWAATRTLAGTGTAEIRRAS